MSQEMEQFIADVYGTGVDPIEKIAAEQVQEQANTLADLEKAAAVQSFTDAVAARGLNLDDYSNEDVAAAFNQHVESFQKEAAEAAQPSPDEDEQVKQAWLEADQIGRAKAQQEFLDAVKTAAAEKALEIKNQGTETPAETPAEPAPEKTAMPEGLARYMKEKGNGEKKEEKAEEKKEEKEEEKEASIPQTPFLDTEIRKMALAIGISSGCITPEGECNLDKEGHYVKDPTWKDQVELEMPKTALDQTVYGLALQHLADLGYPVKTEGE